MDLNYKTKDSKYIVVGANGFLGSQIVDRLVRNQKKTIAIYRNNSSNINPKAKLIHYSKLDVLTESSYIIFFVVGNYSDTSDTIIQNSLFLSRILQNFKKSKIIYISSTNVYGCQEGIITLTSKFYPNNVYSHSKLLGESIVRNAASFSIIRFTYLYGNGITNDSFIPTLIKRAKRNGIVEIHGDGSRLQDYLHVTDAANLCLLVAEQRSNKVYLGASGISVTNREIGRIIADACGAKLVHLGKDNSCSYRFDPEATLNELGWQPLTDIKTGIIEMCRL